MFSLHKFPTYDYNKEKPVIVSDSKEFLKSSAVVIDQYDGKEFNLNDGGWPRNDIAQLARAQSKSEFDSIMQRLAVRDSGKSNFADGMTDAQIYDSVRSRYAQSPLELQMFVEYSNGSITDYLNSHFGKKVNTDEVKQVGDTPAEQTE